MSGIGSNELKALDTWHGVIVPSVNTEAQGKTKGRPLRYNTAEGRSGVRSVRGAAPVSETGAGMWAG